MQLGGVNRQTAINHLDLFDSTHLIYRLKPYGYSKKILRGKDKVYLADAALPSAVLLWGRKLLADPQKLGTAAETAFFKHIFMRYYGLTPRFSYWQDKRNRDLEVDPIAQIGDRIFPFEMKYQDADTSMKRLKGLRLFLEEHNVKHGYVITQRWDDLKLIKPSSAGRGRESDEIDATILSIPAPLACFWLSGGTTSCEDHFA